jgi:CrcB protein
MTEQRRRGFDQEFAPDQLPLDPDVDEEEDQRRHRRNAAPADEADTPDKSLAQWRWPRLRLQALAAVFAGGCIGGYARYVITTAWTADSGAFPQSTFAVNVAGAFILALVIVVAIELRPVPYLRPLLGTGFCGALTTFSSVVVTVDQLYAHGHTGTAAGYLAATIVGGLAAASFGLVIGRSLSENLRGEQRDGSH